MKINNSFPKYIYLDDITSKQIKNYIYILGMKGLRVFQATRGLFLASAGPRLSNFANIRFVQTVPETHLKHDEFTQHAIRKEKDKIDERKARDEEDQIRNNILNAGLQFVPKLGWSRDALSEGAKQLGYPTTLGSIVPDAGIGLVHHHYKVSNAKLEQLMAKQVETFRAQNQPVKKGLFLRQNVEARLRMNIPYMPRWPEAIALMSMPLNVPQSLSLALDLMDGLWYYAGDTATDFNWYTKRSSLMVIYKTTEIAMMQDKSPDYADTWKFLDRRFEDHFFLSSRISFTSPDDLVTVFGGLATTTKILLGLGR